MLLLVDERLVLLARLGLLPLGGSNESLKQTRLAVCVATALRDGVWAHKKTKTDGAAEVSIDPLILLADCGHGLTEDEVDIRRILRAAIYLPEQGQEMLARIFRAARCVSSGGRRNSGGITRGGPGAARTSLGGRGA